MNAKTRQSRLDACKTPNAAIYRPISYANVSLDSSATAKSSAEVSAASMNGIFNVCNSRCCISRYIIFGQITFEIRDNIRLAIIITIIICCHNIRNSRPDNRKIGKQSVDLARRFPSITAAKEFNDRDMKRTGRSRITL